MQRTTLTIDGHSYVLAQGTDLGKLKASAEDAVLAGGRFVDLTVVGNVAVSVLVSPGVAIFLTTRSVPVDNRDTGEVADPYAKDAEWDLADLY
jgi:hypothetical protein